MQPRTYPSPHRPALVCWPSYWHAIEAKRTRVPLWARLAPSWGVVALVGALALGVAAWAILS